ncbi:MAG: hypothetical protein R6X34_16330 [Chloroflexota bacterium]|jgi:hypothetical protein
MQSYFLSKYEPVYPVEEWVVGEGPNLALLCIRLNETFSQYDLLALCVELRLMPGRFGLDRPHLKLEGLIALIDSCHKNGRLPDLFTACRHIRPGVLSALELTPDVKKNID